MGVLIRLPFYLLAIFIWTFIGGFISFVNLLTLPVSAILISIFPSFFKNSIKDILTLKILWSGYRKINNFLRYGSWKENKCY